jgi:hypothetical protein
MPSFGRSNEPNVLEVVIIANIEDAGALRNTAGMSLVPAFRPLAAHGGLSRRNFCLRANCFMMAQIVSVVQCPG